MRYPIHRSLILWGALLVMGFTVWAWVDSRGMESYFRWPRMTAGSAHNGVTVVVWGEPVAAPGVTVHRVKKYNPFPDEVAPLPFFLRGSGHAASTAPPEGEDLVEPEDPRNFKELVAMAMSERSQQYWFLFVPYWLVLAGTALGAGLLIAWRARSWRKWRKLQEMGGESTMEVVE